MALGLALWGKSVPALPGGDLTSWCGARGQGCVFWQSVRRVDEEQEQQVDMKLFVYGTRTSKDKSGAYLFLPDNEAKVPRRLTELGGSWGGRTWEEPGLPGLVLLWGLAGRGPNDGCGPVQ